MRYPVIYCIKNSINGKVYVGSAIKGLSSRKYLHRKLLNTGLHHSKHLQRAWNMYGEDVFEWHVLEKLKSKTNIIDREQFWMDLLQAYKKEHGYNISPTAGSNAGAEFYRTEAFRAKMRENAKNNVTLLSIIAARPHSMKRRLENAAARSVLSEDQVVKVKAALAAGEYQADIARKFSISQSTISLIKNNVTLAYGGTGRINYKGKRKPAKITDIDRDCVRQMYQSGMTQMMIHDKTGYSQSVISNIVRS